MRRRRSHIGNCSFLRPEGASTPLPMNYESLRPVRGRAGERTAASHVFQRVSAGRGRGTGPSATSRDASALPALPLSTKSTLGVVGPECRGTRMWLRPETRPPFCLPMFGVDGPSPSTELFVCDHGPRGVCPLPRRTWPSAPGRSPRKPLAAGAPLTSEPGFRPRA